MNKAAWAIVKGVALGFIFIASPAYGGLMLFEVGALQISWHVHLWYAQLMIAMGAGCWTTALAFAWYYCISPLWRARIERKARKTAPWL